MRNWVTRIRRDSHDRLWFCTVEGLSLFDGKRFINYTTDDGLPNRKVNDILEAGDGYYWLATGSGLYRFRPRTLAPAVFTRVPIVNEADAGAPEVLFRTRSGELWVGAERALFQVEDGRNPRAISVHVLNELRRPDGSLYIHALTEGPDGSLWVGADQGVMRRTRDGTLSFWKPLINPTTTVKALAFDRDGVLWAGGIGGYATLDTRLAQVKIERHPMGTEQALSDIQSIFQDSRGTIWMGARGLVSVEPIPNVHAHYRFRHYPAESLLGSQYSFSMEEDTRGDLWVALSNLGVARVIRHGVTQFAEADGLESSHVDSIGEDRNGTLFVVTGSHHTLNAFDGHNFVAVRERVPSTVTQFGWGENNIALESGRGEWWIATGQGLLRYPHVSRITDLNHVQPKVIYGPSNGLSDPRVTRLFEDSRGDIWIGSAAGIARWRASLNRIEDISPQFGHTFSQLCPVSFAEDASGSIWIGLFPNGLVRIRDERIEVINDSPSQGSINFLLTDKKKRLWIATSRQGLALIDDPGDEHPSPRIHPSNVDLKSKHLFALTEDQSGRIYIAGGRGVDRLDPISGAVYHFSSKGELPLGETQRIYCDRSGTIWFASNFGLSRYVPQEELANVPATPVIHEVKSSGTVAFESDEGDSWVRRLHLDHDQHLIEITYGSVDFSVGEEVHYFYRLKGLQTDWQEANAAGSIQFAGVGSGDYRFEIRSVSSSGIQSAGIAIVDFSVAAPFWRTWWFLTFSIAVLVAVALSAHFTRVRHLIAVERVRTMIAADLHDDLGSGLAEIAVLTEVAKRQGGDKVLEGIAQRARELRASMSDIIWSVDPSCDDLEHLIRRLRETAFSLLPSVALEFTAPEASESSKVQLSPDRRRHLLLFFKEAVNNVSRHSGANRVWIALSVTAKRVDIEIRDDGCGWTAEPQRAGNGLKNMARRAELLGGVTKISSTADVGTRVILSVPLHDGSEAAR